MTPHRPNSPNAVSAHYGRQALRELIQQGLDAVGKGSDAHLTTDDLSALDHFHIGGKDATLQLAGLAAFEPGWQVLDVGGGLGGPARTLAETGGHQVTVLDLTPEFCAVGSWLTERTWLSDQVQFEVGDALDMPFPDHAFDAAWTQHSSMNIPDKETLYRELHRVVRTGGRLAFHEILGGPGGSVNFPVPWATEPSISHLRPASDVRQIVAKAGFRERFWRDTSADSIAWFRQRLAAAGAAPTPPPLGLHLLLGAAAPQMFQSMLRNLEERRIVGIQAVFERP